MTSHWEKEKSHSEMPQLSTESLAFVFHFGYAPFSGSMDWSARMCVCVCFQLLSCMTLFSTPWTVAHQAPPSMGFSWQEYWSELPFPPPGDLPDSGIEPVSLVFPALQADSLPLSHQGSPGKSLKIFLFIHIYFMEDNSEGQIM